MNTYPCWYRGNLGYGCRIQGRKWMFVPDFGQSDNNIHKNLCLEDLVFRNSLDKHFELRRDEQLDSLSLVNRLRALFFSPVNSQSVAGELLSRF